MAVKKVTTAKTNIGRPTKYTPELAQSICDIVASHPYGIRKTIKLYPELPDGDVINEWWCHQYEDFAKNYREAHRKRSDLLFESALDELEELENYVYINPITGAKEINLGIVAIKKAIADQKMRHAVILNPKYRLEKRNEEDDFERDEMLKEFQAKVDEFNKINKSEY